MLSVGFEPTIPTFERAKTVHALDRAAPVTGSTNHYPLQFISTSFSCFLAILSHFSLYCGIFAQSKNCGAREAAVASERL
jgi:hypothetical protein